MAYFQLLTPRESIIFGKKLAAGEAGIQPGILVKLESGGQTVKKCGAADTPFGFAYGARALIYAPTTAVFAIGEPMSVVQGSGLALMSSDFFTSGSGDWATEDAILYAAADGKLSTSGSTKVARVIQTKSRTVVGGPENVALVRFNIQP